MDKPNWFYVDSAGKTSAAVTQETLKQLYQSKAITDETYVWNGTTVKSWMTVASTAQTSAGLIQSLRAAPPAQAAQAPRIAIPAAPPATNPAPKAVGGGGGGRSALLDAIRLGASLKKAPAPAKNSGGGGGGMRSGGAVPCRQPGGGPMSMQDEMRARFEARASNAAKSPPTKSVTGPVSRGLGAPTTSGGFGGSSGNRRPSANVPGSPQASNGRAPPGGRSPPGPQGARGPGGFGTLRKSQTQAPNGSPVRGNKSLRGPPGIASSGGNSNIDDLVRKLKILSPSDWQVKAIEKILN